MSFKQDLLAGLKPGVNTINQIDIERFPAILNRIAVSFINNSGDFSPFAEDEEEALSEALSISRTDVRVLLESSAFIFKQNVVKATFNVTKPAVLRQQLIEGYGLDKEKAEVFVSTWMNQAKNIVGALKQKSLFPSQTEAVNWMLTTRVSTSGVEGCELRPASIIDLQLGPDKSNKSLLRLDLDQTQLARLYLTLEEVQTRLDDLR